MVTTTILGTVTGLLKVTEIVVLIVVMAMFFSAHGGWQLYVASSIVGAWVHTVLLLTVYLAGGLAIQQTLWEVMLNSYHGLMLTITSIVIYSESKDSVAIASASISLIVAIVYFIDTYVALRNTGALAPALGGQAPRSQPGPVSTSNDPQLQLSQNLPPVQPQSYPNPLGINNTDTQETNSIPPSTT